MRLPIFIIILGTVCGCSKPNGYKIDRKSKTISESGDCQIAMDYPSFVSAHQLNGEGELNELLSGFPDYESYMHQCGRNNGKKLIVNGDYRLTLETPDLLSIEFITAINFDGNYHDTVFHSLVINPKNIIDRNGIFSTPEMLFANFNRKLLYEYVKAFNEQNNKKVNLLAYEKDSNYVITWGLAKDKLLLYVGGEGEGFGYHRIDVPLSEFGR